MKTVMDNKTTMMVVVEAKVAAMVTVAAVELFTAMSDGDGGNGKSNSNGGGEGGGS